MRIHKRNRIKRHTGFFRVGLAHDNLVNHYHTNFALMQHHGYSLTELDNMLPFEREIYLALLLEWLEKEEQRRNNNG